MYFYTLYFSTNKHIIIRNMRQEDMLPVALKCWII